MFKAFGRWLKAVSYLLTGQIDAARRTLDTSSHAIRAKYDDIVRDKINTIQEYKKAVAGLIAQQEGKMARVKSLTEEVEKFERLKSGALAKAKQRVKSLGAKSKEEVQRDEEYRTCLHAYNDFVSTLAEKQDHIAELEQDIEQYGISIKQHKIQLQDLAREIEAIRAEASDAVADMITADHEKDLADTLSGIVQDGTAGELQRLRQLRQEVKAEARVSKELAGVDIKAQEAEFLEYARTSAAEDEFATLVGLAEETDDALKTGLETAVDQDEKRSLPE